MNKTFSRILSFALSGALLLGSASAAEESVFTRQMVERSLYQTGNTQRLHKAIDKARAGEKVSMVYLGGSITEGALAQPQQTHCYAALSARLFAEKFMADPAQLEYHNAGISGTPSLLGVTRCEQDVLAYKPDIVFVEFAVNDSSDANAQMAYESLVRKLLNSETQPAVVLVLTLMSGGYSAHVHMKQIGKHYDLGVVSVYDAIKPQLDMKLMAWSDYSSDYAHPTTEGHAFIADLIGYYFDQAAATEPTDYVIPVEARYSKSLENLRNIRQGDPAIITGGSFPYTNVTCYSYTKGWRHSSLADSNDPLVLQVTGAYMTIAIKQEPNQLCGKAEVWVDGHLKTTLAGYAENAWGNVVTELIPLGENTAHTVEIRMAADNVNKYFSLLDIAVAAE
ncbi:MAG: SGNH/GDSL hydrolase family protein [Clostridiales bacterium]|nr:SGNH/GDSL hydrolase family protein [Clostridiales bacterium]